MGHNRAKYFLATMDAVVPHNGQSEAVYRASDDMVRSTQLKIESQTLSDYVATLPVDSITLDFLTPIRLKHKGRWITEGPPFEAVISKLLGRISSLSYFHCGHRLEADFRGLIDRAAQVEMTACQTRWADWSRVSGRQNQRIKLGGLVGRVTYTGNLRDYLPLLALGELVHVGKGTVFGNGQYKILTDT